MVRCLFVCLFVFGFGLWLFVFVCGEYVRYVWSDQNQLRS
jgi:hypothetical protein